VVAMTGSLRHRFAKVLIVDAFRQREDVVVLVFADSVDSLSR